MKFYIPTTTAVTILLAHLTTSRDAAQSNYHCYIKDYLPANAERLSENIGSIMQNTEGKRPPAQLGGAVGWCWRLACQYNTAILMCNDAGHPLTVPWNDITDAAYDIKTYCYKDGMKNYNGEFKDPSGWSVKFGGDRC